MISRLGTAPLLVNPDERLLTAAGIETSEFF